MYELISWDCQVFVGRGHKRRIQFTDPKYANLDLKTARLEVVVMFATSQQAMMAASAVRKADLPATYGVFLVHFFWECFRQHIALCADWHFGVECR